MPGIATNEEENLVEEKEVGGLDLLEEEVPESNVFYGASRRYLFGV